MVKDGLFIPSEYAQGPLQNLSVSVDKGSLFWKFSGAFLRNGNCEKNSSNYLRKNLSIHINIYMEKSLKQREQLEGYLRDKLQQLSQKQPLVVLLEEKENDE